MAVCGFSGEILGPPNHHSFQTTVARLHREQFYNLPLDRYKARIRTEKDEALVAKWLEEQSTTTVFIPLTAEEVAADAAAEAAAKVASEIKPTTATQTTEAGDAPAEAVVETPETAANAAASTPSGETAPPDESPPLETTEAVIVETEAASGTDDPIADSTEPVPTADNASTESSAAESPAVATEPALPVEPLKNWAAVEAHFLAHHADKAVRAVSRIKVAGNIPGKLLAPSLLALLRMEVEQQQRFPMQLVQDLCRDLEKESLKFFKRDKKATFVCRTRPHFIDDESHLSPRLRSIVGVVRANPGITVGKLVSTLAPHIVKPASKPEVPKAPVAEVPAVAVVEATAVEDPAPTGATTATESPAVEAAPVSTEENPSLTEETPANDVAAAPAPSEAPTDTLAAETPPSEPSREPRERGPKNQRNKKPAPAPEGLPAPLTMEEIGVLQDLRWLVGEGLVTEFATGELQILGRPPQPPAEKKPRPDHKPDTARAAPAAAEGPCSIAAPEPESIATASSESPAPGESVLAEVEVAAAEDVFQEEGNPLPNTHEEPES